MKLAILSDFHLGYERFAEDAYKQAKEALEKASEVADVLLIPGDIFDTRNPKPETLAEAINIFRELGEKEWKAKVTSFQSTGEMYTDLPIIAVAGTHERRAKDVENPVDLMHLAGFLVDVSNGSVVIEKDGEKVAVCGIGGIEDQMFNGAIEERNPKPVAGTFNVFMFHESIYELLPFNENFTKLEELPEGFDLYVNGHLHSRTEEKVHGKRLLIPGSTVLTQLKEGEQDAKGFFLFDTENYSYKFHEIECRKFHYVKFDIGGLSNEAVIAKLNERLESLVSKESEHPVIKVQLGGKMDSDSNGMDIDLHQITRRFKDLATIELSKSGVESAVLESGVADAKEKMLDSTSIKDYGMGLFMEKFKEKKGDLKISASELFELLSAEGNKDKVLRAALEQLL